MNRKSITSLKLEDVCFSYQPGVPILENLNLEVPKSPAVWMKSFGGRGKSTMLRVMSGLLIPQSGRYLVSGENLCEMSFEEFLPYRLNIGYGFDSGGLLNNRTIKENLLLPLQYHSLVSEEEAIERVEKALDTFAITHVRDLRPFAVSGSVRKIACLIRALIHWPEVVFLDDPLNALNESNLNDFLKYVEESFVQRGLKQVIFTSENPRLAQAFPTEELKIGTAA